MSHNEHLHQPIVRCKIVLKQIFLATVACIEYHNNISIISLKNVIENVCNF